MPNRQTIQHLAMELPGGHESVHQRDEAGVVGRLQQVHQFVDNKVFEALDWLLGQLGVEANRVCCVVAAHRSRTTGSYTVRISSGPFVCLS